MDRQEVAQELGQPGAQKLLASGPLLRLANNGSDGLPRVIPIGFHWTGSHIVICTTTTSPKVKALAVRPEVAVTGRRTNRGLPARRRGDVRSDGAHLDAAALGSVLRLRRGAPACLSRGVRELIRQPIADA